MCTCQHLSVPACASTFQYARGPAFSRLGHAAVCSSIGGLQHVPEWARARIF